MSLLQIIAHGILNIMLDTDPPKPLPSPTPIPQMVTQCNQSGIPDNEGPWLGRVCHEIPNPEFKR